jgi:hypothetical protein
LAFRIFQGVALRAIARIRRIRTEFFCWRGRRY